MAFFSWLLNLCHAKSSVNLVFWSFVLICISKLQWSIFLSLPCVTFFVALSIFLFLNTLEWLKNYRRTIAYPIFFIVSVFWWTRFRIAPLPTLVFGSTILVMAVCQFVKIVIVVGLAFLIFCYLDLTHPILVKASRQISYYVYQKSAVSHIIY